MKKRILSILVLIFVILVVFVFYYTHPKNITRSINGVEYALGSNNTKPVKINIQGKLQRSLLGNKTFVGKIALKGVSYPNQYNNKKLTIKFQDNGMGIITYAFYKNGTPILHSYGVIFANKDLSKVSIVEYKTVNDHPEAWNTENGLIISGPASSKNKALEIANNVMKNFLKGNELK